MKFLNLFMCAVLSCGLAMGIGFIGCGGGAGDGGGEDDCSETCTSACQKIDNCGWIPSEEFGDTVQECIDDCPYVGGIPNNICECAQPALAACNFEGFMTCVDDEVLSLSEVCGEYCNWADICGDLEPGTTIGDCIDECVGDAPDYDCIVCAHNCFVGEDNCDDVFDCVENNCHSCHDDQP